VEKNRPKRGPTYLCQIENINISVLKRSTRLWGHFSIFKKLSNVNNHPMSENSPNLATLVVTNANEPETSVE
jgi:hypothetical protein